MSPFNINHIGKNTLLLYIALLLLFPVVSFHSGNEKSLDQKITKHKKLHQHQRHQYQQQQQQQEKTFPLKGKKLLVERH